MSSSALQPQRYLPARPAFRHLTTSAIAPTFARRVGLGGRESVGAFSTTQLGRKTNTGQHSHSPANRAIRVRWNGGRIALEPDHGPGRRPRQAAIVAELLKAGTLDNHNASEVDTFVTVSESSLLYDAVDGIFASHIDQLARFAWTRLHSDLPGVYIVAVPAN